MLPIACGSERIIYSNCRPIDSKNAGLNCGAAGNALSSHRKSRVRFLCRCDAVIFLPNSLYNQTMKFCSSFLFRCCLAAVLLFSLSASGAQDLWVQDVQENGDIVLTLDADSHANDSFEQVALISSASLTVFASRHVNYPQELAQAVAPNCFPPPDRPPAESV